MYLNAVSADLVYYSRNLYPDESVQDIYLKTQEGSYSVLLESSLGYTQKTSEFSIISVLPKMLLTLRDSQLTLENLGQNNPLRRHMNIKSIDQLLNILHELINSTEVSSDISQISHLPFLGGLLGFISYDFVRYIEKVPDKNNIEYIPDLQFILTKNTIIVDHKESKLWIIAENKENLDYLINKTAANTHKNPLHNIDFKLIGDKKVSLLEPEFIEKVEKTKEYIAQGEIYQANISIRFSQMLQIEPFEFYKMLYRYNPSPFCAYINFDDLCVVCNSPERLIKSYPDKRIETRPIAGTRGRSADNIEDERLEKEMISSAKERSEHIMLVDLERNDLGKVAKYNTVRVDELFTVEKYSHVMHLVSNVVGELGNQYKCIDLMVAMFPGGTITGVPKIRCMEIIEELEPCRRGLYTGSIGYIDYRGSMDLNIVIRTMLLERENGNNYHAKMQFGAGIVADSVGKYEYKECIKKGQAIFSLLENFNI